MSWPEAADWLWHCGTVYYCIFVFYIAFVSIAMVNVIMANYVDATTKAAQKDHISELQEARLASEEFKNSIFQAMQQCNENSNEIDLEWLYEQPVMKAFMDRIGYDRNELDILMNILRKTSAGYVKLQSFIESCFSFSHLAKQLEVVLLLEEQAQIRRGIDQIGAHLGLKIDAGHCFTPQMVTRDFSSGSFGTGEIKTQPEAPSPWASVMSSCQVTGSNVS